MKRFLSALVSVAIIFSSVCSVNALDVIIEEVQYIAHTPDTVDESYDGDFDVFCSDLLELITDADASSDGIGIISDSADTYLSKGATYTSYTEPELLVVKSSKPIDTLDAVDYVGGFDDLYFLQFDNYDSLYEAYDYYLSLSYVEYAQIDGTVYESVFEEDEEVFTEATVHSSTQYASDFFGYTDAKANMGSNEVVVAVIDSGVQHDHEALVGRVEPTGFDAVYNESSYDTRGHGTHVAGIIVANTKSNVTIKPYKIFNNNGEASDTALYLSIMKAIEDDVDIINLSLTKKGDSEIIHEAVTAAYEEGITIVAAAGNNNDNLAEEKYTPASFPEVICTVAVDTTKYKASYSNWGTSKDLSAPGTDILSTYLDNTYKIMSGTSMACPFMTCCVAYLLSHKDTLSPDAVYNTLLNNTKRGGGTHNIKYVTPGTLVQSTTTCAVPVFNYTPGTFSGYIDVSLSCSTPDSEIVYRTSDMPEKTYLSYTGPITITETTSFTAYAFSKGYKNSSSVTAKYTLSGENASDFSIDENGTLLSYSGTTTRLTIPDYVNNAIVTGIEAGAFNNVPLLSSLTCGTYVTTIKSGAFSGCTHLETLTAPSITILEDGLFEDCPIKTLNIISVTEIPAEYFMNSSTLNSIKITGVKIIGDRAFYGTTYLSSVSLSALEIIGESAFENSSISKLESKSASGIGDYAFKNCNITSATFNSVTSLGIGVFENCSMLKSVSLSGITDIPSYTFHNCKGLVSFSLSKVASVGFKAFCNCTSLTKCSFPGTQNITFDESVFENCTALTFVQVPCAFNVSKRMFKNCASLANVRVGSSVGTDNATIKDIGEEGFYGCKSITLDNLSLGTVKSISKNCLVGSGIANTIHKELTLSITTINEGAFNGIRCERVYFIQLDYLYDIPDNAKIICIDYYLEDVNIKQDLDSKATFFSDSDGPLKKYCENNGLHFEDYKSCGSEVRTIKQVEPVCYGKGYEISFEAVAFDAIYVWYGANQEDLLDRVQLPSQRSSTLNLYDFLQKYPDYEYKYYFCIVSTSDFSKSSYHHPALNASTMSNLFRYDPDPNNSIVGTVSGTEGTVIDYSRGLVITDSLDNINTFSNIFADTSSNFSITASQNYMSATCYGTGSVITISSRDGATVLKTLTLVVKGDMNGDGVVDALDASQVALYSNKKASTNVKHLQCAADLDGSGHVDVTDYQAVVNKVVS